MVHCHNANVLAASQRDPEGLSVRSVQISIDLDKKEITRKDNQWLLKVF